MIMNLPNLDNTFSRPTPEERHISGDAIRAAEILARLLGCAEPLDRAELLEAVDLLADVAPEIFESYRDTPEAFADAWNDEKDLFLGEVAPVKLEESVYRAWTSDEAHPLAGVKGLSWGDSARHMSEVLRTAGLELDQDDSLPPDHLSVLLEFLAWLSEHGSPEQVIGFCTDHLAWVTDIRVDVERTRMGKILPLLLRAVELLTKDLTAELADRR